MRLRRAASVLWVTPTAISGFTVLISKLEQTGGSSTHHLDGSGPEVQLRDGRVVGLQDVDAFPGQGLDDGLVALERGGLVSVQDEPAHPTVQLS